MILQTGDGLHMIRVDVKNARVWVWWWLVGPPGAAVVPVPTPPEPTPSLATSVSKTAWAPVRSSASGSSPYKPPGGRWRDGNVQVISDDETNVPQRLLVINPTDAGHRRTQFLQVEVTIVHPEPLDSVGWTVLGMYAVNASNVEVGASATAVGIHLSD